MNLGFYCLGHGITVADRSRIENGDYKNIAWIRPSGVIEYRIREGEIPPEALEQIRKQAEATGAEFMRQWEALPEIEQYKRILEALTIEELIQDRRGTPARETIDRFFEEYKKRV